MSIVIVLAVVIGLVFTSTALVRAYNDSFWDRVADIIGSRVADKMSVPAEYESEEVAVGSAGDTYSRRGIAQISIDSTTSTIGAIYNNSGRDRILERAFVWIEDTTGVEGTTTDSIMAFAVATSTGNSGTSSTVIFRMAYSTGTESVYASTSGSEIGTNGRKWASSTHLLFHTYNLTLNATTAETNGVVGVEYFYDDE